MLKIQGAVPSQPEAATNATSASGSSASRSATAPTGTAHLAQAPLRRPVAAAGTSDLAIQPRRQTGELFKSAVRRLIAKPITGDDIEGARQRADALTYKQVYETINERYKDFSQKDERGFAGMEGLTGSISDIKVSDLIGILRHIASSAPLAEQASKKSGLSQLFEKIYLMENNERGWNLRLHRFSPDAALDDEEAPHQHRWTLASRLLLGGYDNKNYQEIPASGVRPGDADDQLLHKYRLGPSPAGANVRVFTPEGTYGVRKTKDTLFQAGDVRHFPIELPHSVCGLSAHTGTTLTLAHTGKPVSDSSFAYRTEPDLTSAPIENPANLQEFVASVRQMVALLQITSLSDALHNHLQEKPASSLSPMEKRHLQDHQAPNYLETSLMPALAIFGLGQKDHVAGQEFSEDTVKFLKDKLRRISESSLGNLIERNQKNIESGIFSTRLSSWNELKVEVESKTLAA